MDIDTGTEELLCDLRDRVLTVTLNRPQARNALSMELMFAFRRILAEYGDHKGVGALVVTGAGSAFCSGGDVKRMAARKANDHTAEEKFQVMVARHRESAGVIRQLRIPTVASLPGPAAGQSMASSQALTSQPSPSGALSDRGTKAGSETQSPLDSDQTLDVPCLKS